MHLLFKSYDKNPKLGNLVFLEKVQKMSGTNIPIPCPKPKLCMFYALTKLLTKSDVHV